MESQIVKMGEAFQRQGLEVTLLIPFRFQSGKMKQVENIWQYYEVDTPFKIIRCFSPDFIPLERVLPGKILRCFYYFQYVVFACLALIRTFSETRAVYYSRSLQTLFLLCLTKWLHRKPIYFEAHEFHGDPQRTGWLRHMNAQMMRWMLRRVDGLIVITDRAKRERALQAVTLSRS